MTSRGQNLPKWRWVGRLKTAVTTPNGLLHNLYIASIIGEGTSGAYL